jgi:DNA polymerase IV
MSPDFPPIYLLPTNLLPDELHSLEERIPSLTWNPHEAEILLGRITRPERARFELRRLKLETEEIRAPVQLVDDGDGHSSKRQRTSGPAGGGGGDNVDDGGESQGSEEAYSTTTSSSTVKVVKLTWLLESLDRGVVLPTKDYLLYEGKKLPAANEKPTPIAETPTRGGPARSILKRAAADKPDRPGPAANPASPRNRHQQTRPYTSPAQRPPLLHETTSEHDLPLPPVPDFLHTSYSCQRPTPVDTPNAAFVEELKEIRTLRLLEGDKVGVRAYSSSIAAVAAYPYPLQTSAG